MVQYVLPFNIYLFTKVPTSHHHFVLKVYHLPHVKPLTNQCLIK